MKRATLKKIMRNKKVLFLAYDQGMEHGPVGDFNDKNIDPLYIIEIASKGKYDAIIFQKGIAEKYSKEIKNSKIPLIIKLNGKTRLASGEPLSAQICSVEEAKKLGAKAVGFTIYIGSKYESKMIEQFSLIEKEAHKSGLPVIAWIYPRGEGTKGKTKKELLAYACRVGLELGADIVKVHWESETTDLKFAVKSAGRCKVLIAGGEKGDEKMFLKKVSEASKTGITGLAVGRNIWQSNNPLELTKKLRKIISK